MKPREMKCALCGKEGCKPWERNTDGTYTHSECLYATSLVVAGKGPKGGNLFTQRTAVETRTDPPAGTGEPGG